MPVFDRLRNAIESSLTFKRYIEKRIASINGEFSRNTGRGLINVLLQPVGLIHHRFTKSRVRLVAMFAFKI